MKAMENKFIKDFKDNCGNIGIHVTEDGRIGIGRNPLYKYKLDIGVPSKNVYSGLHIGDGKSGFTMGNGSSQSFTPQIIGMGSDENDSGLYFIGRAGNNKESNTPLVVIDGRNRCNSVILNRPIFGITSNDTEYKFKIESSGDCKISGRVYANGIDLINEIEMLKKEIEMLKCCGNYTVPNK